MLGTHDLVGYAAGMSRAATACLSFMILRRGMSLDAAFTLLVHARRCVGPNGGFWRQLRQLEADLCQRGVALRGLQAGELEWVEAQKELVYTPEEFERYSKRKAKRRQPLDVKTIIEDLDEEAAATLSSKMYLKVRIHLVEGCEVNAEWVRQQLFGTNQFECTLIEDQPGAILAARLALDVTKWPEDAARGQMVRTVLFGLLGEHATRIDIEQSLV